MTMLNERTEPLLLARTPARLLRTLVVGAGEAGRALARDLAATPTFGLEPVAFVDDNLIGRAQPAPYPVLGRLADVERVVTDEDVDVVVIAIPGLEPEVFKQVSQAASRAGASIRYLPSFVAALERKVVGSDMRWLDVGQLGR